MTDPPSRLARRQWLQWSAATAGLLATTGCNRSRRRPGEVRLWFSYGGNNRKVLLELVEQFHRAQTAVRVKATFQGDYFEGLAKLRAGLFVGAPPTVTHVVGEVVPYLDAVGALASLEGIGAETTADLVPALAQSGTFSGAERPLVALPFNRSTPVCYYNKTLFQELGLKPPRSWGEMRAVAKAATLADPAGGVARWGFECPIDWWFWIALLGQAGGQVIEDDGRIELGGEAGAKAIEHWQAMINSDRSMRPPAGRDFNAWQVTNGDFLAGRAAMIWTSTAFLRYLEKHAKFEVGVAPLPAGVRHSVPTGGTFFVMPKGLDAAEQQAGLTFLRWMMAPAQANTWATRTGYMPVSRGGTQLLQEQGFFDENPNFKVTLDQLAVAQPWPWEPELFRVQREVVQPRLEEAVLRARDPRPLLQEARRLLRR